MMESAVVAVTPKSRLDNYYQWVEPNCDITVWLKLATAERLQLEVLRGSGFRARAGLEVGGILLGRTERHDGRAQLFIEDFEAVPCAHLNGPAYALTASDIATFEAALARHGSREALLPVGFFRGHNREGLFLSPEDLGLIQCFFREPDNLFLLIKTLSSGACTAGFFFWKDGHIQADFTDSEAPLIPVALSAADRDLFSRKPVEQIAVAPAFVAPPQSEPKTHRRLLSGLAIAGIAAACTVAVVRYKTGPREQKPGASQPVPAVVAKGTPAALNPVPAPAPAREQVARADSSKPRLPNPPLTFLVPAPNEAPAARSPAFVESGNPLPSTPAQTTSPVVETPALPPPPAAENPLSRIETAPVPTPAAPAPPALQAAHTLIGPKMIHQAIPEVPGSVEHMIMTAVQIDVAVSIDAHGLVTGARIAAIKGFGAGLLTNEALKAARLFRFEPAKDNGREVASNLVITFHFSPRNNARADNSMPWGAPRAWIGELWR